MGIRLCGRQVAALTFNRYRFNYISSHFPAWRLGRASRADGGAPRADDWITINKNYFGQRYVDLDQIMPRNVGRLKEVCEIQLNENSLFSTGLLKVGRTLYVNLANVTYAFDAATCDLRWLHRIEYQLVPKTGNNRGPAFFDGAIYR